MLVRPENNDDYALMIITKMNETEKALSVVMRQLNKH